jgi:repressor LexA
MALTKRQREVYDFIKNFIERKGYSPSFEEMCAGLKLNSLATVHKHLTNLEKKGLVRRDHNRSRAIDIVPERKAKVFVAQLQEQSLPLVGVIAAGRPLETYENPETISLQDVTRSKEVFVLQVRGDSMQDEHIMNGDYVMVEKMKYVRNGEIVVALVGGSDTTLKRFYKEGSTVRLQPSNAAMAPIMVPAQDVEVQGRVIGVLRKY